MLQPRKTVLPCVAEPEAQHDQGPEGPFRLILKRLSKPNATTASRESATSRKQLVCPAKSMPMHESAGAKTASRVHPQHSRTRKQNVECGVKGLECSKQDMWSTPNKTCSVQGLESTQNKKTVAHILPKCGWQCRRVQGCTRKRSVHTRPCKALHRRPRARLSSEAWRDRRASQMYEMCCACLFNAMQEALSLRSLAAQGCRPHS
jgi:hypothetical protein